MTTTPDERPDPASPLLDRLVATFVARVEFARAGQLASLAAEVAADVVDARDVALYLVNLEQTDLVPLAPMARAPRTSVLPLVDDAPAGRAFLRAETVIEGVESDGDRRRVWAPVEVGADRLGVLALDLPADAVSVAAPFARVVGQAVRLKLPSGDEVDLTRRTQDMTVGAELIAALVPPLAFSSEGLALAALLEPSYSSGGDAIDYAVDDGVVHLAILDAMGHGFPAAAVSAVALAAYRNARRLGQDLVGSYQAMETFVHTFAADGRFVTALLAELDTDTGRLSWVSAGHPPPLVVRAGGDAPMVLSADPVPPLGTDLALEDPAVHEEYLESGDLVVLYTDGLTEARNLAGELIGLEGLGGLLTRLRQRGLGVTDVVRAVRQEISTNDDAWLSDDATALLVEWTSTLT